MVMEELAEFPGGDPGLSQGSTVIQVQQVDEQYYLFLPASADSKQLKLNCDLKEGQRLYVAGDRTQTGQMPRKAWRWTLWPRRRRDSTR